LAVAHLAKQCPEIRGLPVEKSEAILPHLAPRSCLGPSNPGLNLDPGLTPNSAGNPKKWSKTPSIVLDLS